MNCSHARRLFGACWDDDITQAERDWLESHFASCPRCRAEYEDLARTLELVTTLPRTEPAPDLVDRVLARTRRAGAAPDRLRVARPVWVPVAAAAAALLVLGTALWPLVAPHAPLPSRDAKVAASAPVQQAERVTPAPLVAQSRTPGPATHAASATIPENLFDHRADVEFVLDPVTLHRGRPTVTRPPAVHEQQATITF